MQVINEMTKNLNENGFCDLGNGKTLYKGSALREAMCDFVQAGMKHFEIRDSEDNDIYVLKDNFECEKLKFQSEFVANKKIFDVVYFNKKRMLKDIKYWLNQRKHEYHTVTVNVFKDDENKKFFSYLLIYGNDYSCRADLAMSIETFIEIGSVRKMFERKGEIEWGIAEPKKMYGREY